MRIGNHYRYSGAHPGWCSCKTCTPRHPNDQGIHPFAYIIGLAILAVAVVLI